MTKLSIAIQTRINDYYLMRIFNLQQRAVILKVLEEGSKSVVNNLFEIKTILGAVNYYKIETDLADICIRHREEN